MARITSIIFSYFLCYFNTRRSATLRIQRLPFGSQRPKSSLDIFNNPTSNCHERESCSKFQAVCYPPLLGPCCVMCQCQPGATFISRKHGCLMNSDFKGISNGEYLFYFLFLFHFSFCLFKTFFPRSCPSVLDPPLAYCSDCSE